MIKILAVCISALLFGALLAANPISLPLRAGYLGALVLIGAAWWLRRYWERRATDIGDDPSVAERQVWLSMMGTALIEGYVLVVLLTPGSEVHRVPGDTGGYDSWVMIAGAVISYLILRSPSGQSDSATQLDERDIAISNSAVKAGYCCLIALLCIFLLLLGFASQALMQCFTHWLIANTLLTIMMLAVLFQQIVQLTLYWRDARQIAANHG